MADRGSALATLSSTSVPPARPPQPLGDLVHLPEGPLAHLCSFLPCRDVGRLQGSCAVLQHSPGCFPSRLRLRRPSWMKRIDITATAEEMEEEARCCSEAASSLAERGARSLQELCFGDAYLIEPFFKEVRARNIRLGLLASVKCQCPGWFLSGWPGADSEQLFCEAVTAGQLPALRELCLYHGRSPSLRQLARALGQGVCPRLEKFEVWWHTIYDLEAVGAALEARAQAPGCVSLKSVRVALLEESRRDHDQELHQQVVEAVMRGLAPWHGSLEELGLTLVSAGQLARVVALLVASDWASLKSLTLVIEGSPSGDSLLHALARGAAPNLTSLDVYECNCSDDAWRELGEAMGPKGECLRRLKALKLVQMFRSPAQLELFTRAVGQGHGCPQLESLSMALDLQEVDDNGDLVDEVEGPWGGGLSHAFRPPQGLPRLKRLQLELTGLWDDFDELAEVLRSRPHAIQPIESLTLRSSPFDSAEVLGRALAEDASLGGLKELVIEPAEDRDDAGIHGPYWSSELVEALARGAGQQLERIELRCCEVLSATVNQLLQALATQAACPRLRCLTVQLSDGHRVEGALDMASLGAILTGNAACSAMLKELDLHATQLGWVEPGALEACLCHPNVMELEVLRLCVVVDKPARDAIKVLDALGGRAGSRLRQLTLVLERPDQTSRVGKALWDADASAVEDHLADIVTAGGLPLIAPMDSWGRQALCVTSSVGGYRHRALEVKAEQALRKREEARWLSSWS